MAVLAPRKRVIDTFVAKELAQASNKMINNSDAFRALEGEVVYRKTDMLESDLMENYKEYLKLLD